MSSVGDSGGKAETFPILDKKDLSPSPRRVAFNIHAS